MTIHYTLPDLLNTLQSTQCPTVATIGFFDGVHLGHRFLLHTLVEQAHTLGGRSVAITFDKHPLEVLRPDLPAPFVLSSLRNKIELIAACEVDHLLVFPFSVETAALSTQEFLAPLLHEGQLTHLVLGYDNRFGRRTDLTQPEYDALIRSLGLHLHRISPLTVQGETVSSSSIRRAVQECDFARAERLLGRPYSFLGIVNHGQKIGRTIHYPTANITPLDPHITLPAVGIYVAEVRIGNTVYPAMAYYGDRPTVDDSRLFKLEAYLIGYSGELYGAEVEIGFRKYLRGDRRFDTITALAEQLQKDEEETLAYFATHPMTLRS